MKTWSDIPGYFDFAATYDRVVDHLGCPGRPGEEGILIECGCYLGRSLCYLGQKVKESGKPWKVVGIDNCKGLGGRNKPKPIRLKLLDNIYECGLSDIVSVMWEDSIQAAQRFRENSVSFIFFDTLHTYIHLSQEIKAWYPKIMVNGVIAGDDVGVIDEQDDKRMWPEVKKTVDELLPGWIYSPHDCWLFHKRGTIKEILTVEK